MSQQPPVQRPAASYHEGSAAADLKAGQDAPSQPGSPPDFAVANMMDKAGLPTAGLGGVIAAPAPPPTVLPGGGFGSSAGGLAGMSSRVITGSAPPARVPRAGRR